MKRNLSGSFLSFRMTLFILCAIFISGLISCKEGSKKINMSSQDFIKPPTIMVTFSWSFSNIGDIGISPGLFNLLGEYIPEAEIILVANTYSKEVEEYYTSRFKNVTVIPSPFKNSSKSISREMFKSIQIPPHDEDPLQGIPFEENSRKFKEAFDRADLILYNSGTTLASYGRWDHNLSRIPGLGWPLFLAREAGKAYGVYCQSFERFAWPANELFVPVLSDANFVFCRDGNSLEYLKSIGVNSPILEFGPDATFAFKIFDEEGTKTFMEEFGLENRKFITLTIRSGRSGQGFLEPGGKRELAHAAKLRELITQYIENTGNKVLICPEVIREIEPARELILDPLPEKIKQNVRFLDKFWLPDIAYTVYSKAEAIVSMEAHSIIMALSVGTPVLHPRFLEAGRKAYMLNDFGLGEWLFDLDEDPVEPMFKELMDIHNNFDAALDKVRSALDIVHKRQKETMAIVRQTLIKTINKK